MSEGVKTKSSGLTPVIIIAIVIAVIFCCLCCLCAAALWFIYGSEYYFEDWQYWSSLIQLAI